CMIWHNNVYIF
nr:immunoglobulin light chain junction region [Macaca mulatta]MPO03158.1 immunoglobulin light chain junction region [Macaca mulatta]MPO03231.1 immunoglobulin light chain junction region [Macaca mulatta]MPO03318.1 immunoglobulin light chain junction region [Macaca mulatta]MPO03328.1 immunoglobulin light chain junction region [Macaca mulatta]